MRRDAERRRDALIQAAAETFSERGYQVPLEDIAQRAGVGRGTLYRNFKDRIDLILAIFYRHIDEGMGATSSSDDLQAVLTTLAVRAAPLSALYSRLAFDLPRDEATVARFKALEARADVFLAPLIERARAAGLVRQDVDPARVQLMLRMIGGLILPWHTPEEAREVCEQALALMMDGLRPR